MNGRVRPPLLSTFSMQSDATSLPDSPSSSARTPITPQNAHFWDSYFPSTQAPEGLVSGMQTPPLQQEHFVLGDAPFPGRKGLLRRNSSLSSMASSVDGEEEEEDDDLEWTSDEEALVRRTYEALLAKHATIEAPFARTGPPPSNFTNMVARAVLRGGVNPLPARRAAAARQATFSGSDAMETSDTEPRTMKWRHSLRYTRLKILALAKERQTLPTYEATPRQGDDPDATPKRRKPLVRNDSMDFLPDVHATTDLSKLGNKLRNPSVDGGVPPPPPAPAAPSAASSGLRALAQPSPQLGALGVPLSRSLSTRPSQRMQRNNSLQSIAGSPSQPKRSRAQVVPEPEKLAPPQLSSLKRPGSQRMARTGSDSSVLPAPTLSRNLSFSGTSSSSSTGQSGVELGSSPHKKTARKGSDGLLTPPPSSKKRPQPFSFLSSPSTTSNARPASLEFRNRLGLTVDTNRAEKATGLGSAFSSPAVGVFPSPTSQSPKKKKARTQTGAGASPVKSPVFPQPAAEQPPALADSAVGLGFGLPVPSLATTDVDGSAPSHRYADDVEDASAYAGSPFSEQVSGSPSSRSFTLLDPSFSPTSLASRRNSPPKLVLTPSLSPARSFQSSMASLPDTPSPLDATFDFRSLKLESLAGSPVESMPGVSLDAGDDDDSDDSFGCDGGSNAFLSEEYIKAGNDAQLLREQFGGFAWDRR